MRTQQLLSLACLALVSAAIIACSGDDAGSETLPGVGGTAAEAGSGGADAAPASGGSQGDASPESSGGTGGSGGTAAEAGLGGSAGSDAGQGGAAGQAGGDAGMPPSGKWVWANPEAFAYDPLAITYLPSGDIIVVGDRGSIWKSGTAGWDVLPSGTTATLRDVVTLHAWGKVIAVGSAGTALSIDGSTVTQLATGISDDLVVVGMLQSGELAAAGGNSIIIGNSIDWISKPAPFDLKDARAIFGDAWNDLFVATPYVVMHFDGSGWTKEFEGTSIGDGAMTTQGPTVLAWDSYVRKSPGVWEKVACNGCMLHRFEDGLATDRAWGLGGSGQRKRYQLAAGTWTEVDSLDWDGVPAGAVNDGATVWLVGGGDVVSLQGYRSRTDDFRSVWTDGPDHAWIAGYDLPGFSTAVGRPVYEVNGSTWTQGPEALSVHGWGAGHPVIGAKDEAVGRFDGTWTWDTITFGPGEQRDVVSVFGVAQNELYALGQMWSGGAKVARYDGSKWSQVSVIGGAGPLYSPGGGVVYSADDYGIWRSDGTKYDMISLQDTYSVHGWDAQHVYAGAGLSVYEISSGTPVQFGGSKQFNCWALWAMGAQELMAAGNFGEMLYGTPSGWQQLESPTTHRIRAMWGTSPSNIWAVGESGTVLKWMP